MSNGYINVNFVFDSVQDPDLGPIIWACISLTDFSIGAATVKPNHDTFLARYTKMMANTAGASFDVIGTASLTGSASFNRALSKHRADSIAAELVAYGATDAEIRTDVGLGSLDIAGTGAAEAYQDRGVLLEFNCPPTSSDALSAFQAAWKSDPLRLQAAPPQ
jgi:hypothetical protein